ncbi:MAG: hypothetical protein E6Q46_09830 [Flavobacterium sp.]|nr:MAG: hypothetical protein E6Q46_09830 [Flavobacterium sp.]
MIPKQKNTKKILFQLNVLGHSETNPILLRMLVTPEFTKVDFGYTTTNKYIRGGWIKMAKETFIENVATKKRYKMIKASGITIAPQKHNFQSNKDWQYYSLFFEPMEQKDAVINLIEKEKGTENDFNYYDVTLKISEAMEVI